jgi:phage-related protein
VATIAKLVAEIGGDPTGLTAALKQSTGAINAFVSTTNSDFQKIGRGVDIDRFIGDSVKRLKSTLRTDLGQIRSDVFRKVITPQDATAAGVEAAVQFNEGLARTIGSLELSGRAGIGPLRAKLSKEFLDVGKLSAAQLAAGIKVDAPVLEREVKASATKAGRSFAQTLTATIHRHRALIPTLAGLLLSQALSGASDVAKATAGLSAVDRQASRTVESLKAGEKILHEFAMLASFILPPIPGLIAAVAGGVISAIVGIFAHGKEQLVKLREDFSKELGGLIDDIDQLGLQRKLEEVLLGKRSSGISPLIRKGFVGGLDDLQAKQRRDLAALRDLGLDLEKGVSLVGRTLTESQIDLISAVNKRQPMIDELKRQAQEITDALFNPEGRTGFGGQLPAVKVTATGPSGALKELGKDLSALISLFKAETAVGREAFGVLDVIQTMYAGINKQLEILLKTDPLGEQTIKLRQMRTEVEELLKPLRELQNMRFPGGVQVTPSKPAGSIFDLPTNERKFVIQGASRIVNDFGIEVRLLTNNVTPLTVQMAELRDATRATVNTLLTTVKQIGQRLGEALNPLSLLSGFIESIAQAATPSFEALDKPLKDLAATVAGNLAPVFEALAPVVEALTPVIGTILQIIAPLLKAIAPILQAFVPILRSLLPVMQLMAIIITFAGQAVATFAGIVLKIVAALANAVGGAIKAIGTVISKIPFLGGIGRGIAGVGQDILNFGNGLNEAGRDMFAAAAEFANARKEIGAIDVNDTSSAIRDLGDAARETAGVLNAPTGFKVEFLRFLASNAVPVNAVQPQATQNIVNVNGPVSIDAKNLTSAQIFDLIRAEAQRRALAQFGSTTRASEALN